MDKRTDRLLAYPRIAAFLLGLLIIGLGLGLALLLGWIPATTSLPTPVAPIATSEAPEEVKLVEQTDTNGAAFTPVIMNAYMATVCDRPNLVPIEEEPGRKGGGQQQPDSVVSGELTKWHPLIISFHGPKASETDGHPNPFLDFRLQVQFIGPSGQVYDVPGFFAGDGQGNGRGDVWQVRFAPDEADRWRYCASFRAGPDVAIALDPLAGESAAFDGTSGTFAVADLDASASGFLKWGRLEYVGNHYLKFHDGPYWIKGGTNSPENFLGYNGFDNTFDRGGIVSGFVHTYTQHIADWRDGDPQFSSANTGFDARGIIGALNYLGDQNVNSIYFMPMNLGGDGQETYPFVSPGGTHYANTHYDVSKLQQWSTVLEHAQRNGVALHIALNETEPANREWLDDGRLDVERKLFYREMIARFSYLLALKWNLSEEIVFTRDEVYQFADYIQALDWASHPIAIHNPAGWFRPYEEILGDSRLSATAVQYEGDRAGELVETWRQASAAAGHPWVVDMDENNPAGVGLSPSNAGDLRRQILYDVYLSGGNIEWFVGLYDLPIGGDVTLEDFRTREAMWEYMWYARRFMEENLPFWAMRPADDLLVGESEAHGGGEVFAQEGVVYAIYLPVATPSGTLLVGDDGHDYWLRWYNPRSGEFKGGAVTVTAAAGNLSLGPPPANPNADWVVLITATTDPTPTATAAPYP